MEVGWKRGLWSRGRVSEVGWGFWGPGPGMAEERAGEQDGGTGQQVGAGERLQ